MPPTYSHLYCRLIHRGTLLNESSTNSLRFASSFNQNSLTSYENFLTLKYWRKKFLGVQQLYDEVTGLKEVHDAQNRVIEAEKHFVLAQEERRNLQYRLAELRTKLNDIYAELDKTTRGEERYVYLVTREHAVLKEEKAVNEKFQEKEREERDYFSVLSSAVKMGHEKERAQSDRTKYWSIIGSVFGTLLGIVGSAISNNRRMKEIRNIVNNSANVENRSNVSELLTNVSKTLRKIENSQVSYAGKLNDPNVDITGPLTVALFALVFVIIIKSLC